LEYLLFVIYLILFAWLVTKTRFFTASGLSRSQLVILFLLKIIIGIAYGWIGLYYGNHAKMTDTWFYHHNGILEYKLLLNNPGEYFTNLFHDPYQKTGVDNFLGSNNSYWNDLKANVFVKILSIFNIFSIGHYYVNVIFFSFLSLFGPIAVYRVMAEVFPSRKKLVLPTTFFIPSFFFWTSGLHKEGLLFVGIALVLYHLYYAGKEKRLSIKRISGVILGLLLLLLLRNFLFVIILPATIAWIIANRFPKYGLACFLSIYILSGILFFTARYIDPRLDFPQSVVNKQQAFMQAKARSNIAVTPLEPTLQSFVKNLPEATLLSFTRPYPKEVKNILPFAAMAEINILLLLFLLFLLFRKRRLCHSPNTVLFCLFFSISYLLMIGYTVNNPGPIVRYRCSTLPLLMVLIVAQTDWEKIGDWLKTTRGKRNINK
jgi:hypothetical protein